MMMMMMMMNAVNIFFSTMNEHQHRDKTAAEELVSLLSPQFYNAVPYSCAQDLGSVDNTLLGWLGISECVLWRRLPRCLQTQHLETVKHPPLCGFHVFDSSLPMVQS